MSKESDHSLAVSESRYRTRLSVRNSTSTSSTFSKDSVKLPLEKTRKINRSISRGRKKNAYPLVRSKNSEILDVITIKDGGRRFLNDFRGKNEEISVAYEGVKRCWYTLSVIITLGAVIMVVVPLTKLVGGVKKDLNNLRTELIEIKKHVRHIENPEASRVTIRKFSKATASVLKNIVREELETFDLDKTGRTDFALESAGGSIVRTIDTENYDDPSMFFGLIACEGRNGPRAMIQAGSAPGQCWAFRGARGAAVVQLIGPVKITAVTLEHIAKEISPSGGVETAPKRFAVYALPNGEKSEKVLLGAFEYDADVAGVQTFATRVFDAYYDRVEFRVESNHGSKEFTCVYRFRVHGSLQKIGV